MHDLEREVADQPGLLRRLGARCLRQVEEWREEGAPRRLVLSGCGDMAFAAQTVAACCAARRSEVPVMAWPAMDLRWFAAQLDARDAVVLASISGRTPRTLEALRLARARGCRTLVLTDDAESPLGLEAERVVRLDTASREQLLGHEYAGYATETPQTRTFLAVLLWELMLADPGFAADEVERVAAALESASAAQRQRAQELARSIAAGGEPQRVHVLGSGPFRPVAAYGAAKLLEYAIHATPQCLEEFHHLEMFTVGAEIWVVALAMDAASRQRWQEVEGVAEELGGHSFGWTTEAASSPDLPTLLFLAAQAMQWQAFELALALGRDPDRWVGGVRRDQIFGLSHRAVRGSRILGASELESDGGGS